jgi:hypothetical protein
MFDVPNVLCLQCVLHLKLNARPETRNFLYSACYNCFCTDFPNESAAVTCYI